MGNINMVESKGKESNPTKKPDYYIIVNPIAGHKQAPYFIEGTVKLLLDSIQKTYKVYHTSNVQDAGRIGREIYQQMSSVSDSDYPSIEERSAKVIVAGGDGTAHEMIEGTLETFENTKENISKALGRWEIIVLPLGTANALFSSLFPPETSPTITSPALETYFKRTSTTPETIYKLSSLISSLSSTGDKHPRRLPITLTSLQPSSTSLENQPKPPIPSHIVLSTSLHASLLATSETLRASHPGIDRFKIAAEQNLGIFFQADVILIPPKGGIVKQYNPKSRNWVKPFTTTEKVKLSGPFTYLLSTTTTPRLEPSFVINPLLSKLPPNPEDSPTMDIVILRPLRDPNVRLHLPPLTGGEDNTAVEEAWKARATEVLTWAYKDGGHVQLTYPVVGEGETEISGDGEVVVETFRCAGFEWTPTDTNHDPSHVICADGSIYTVPKGGRAVVGIMDFGVGENKNGFWVWD